MAEDVLLSSPDMPVFLVGSHRSGTTLLRYMLDAHPNIACPPESKVFTGVNSFLQSPQVIRGLAGVGASREKITDSFRVLVNTLLDAHAARKGKRRWIEKTPNNVWLLDLIDEVYRCRALYILMVRHPLDCIDSLMDFFQNKGIYDDPDIQSNYLRHGNGHYAWAKYWLESTERMLLFAKLAPDRCIMVKYEDLAYQPQKEMNRVFDFLSESTPMNIVNLAFKSPHDKGYGDLKILATRGVHVASINKWHRWPELYVRELWRIVDEVAVACGYSIERMCDQQCSVLPAVAGLQPRQAGVRDISDS
jgi:hypothetical protein